MVLFRVFLPHSWSACGRAPHRCVRVLPPLCALLAVLLLAGLPASPVYAVPNPVAAVTSPDAFAPLGVTLDAPLEAEDIQYSIIAGRTAQVKFTLNGRTYLLRGTKGDENISGVYGPFSGEPQLYTLSCGGSTALSEQKSTASGGRVGLWRWHGLSFSLFSPAQPDAAAFTALLLRLARTACEENQH